MATTYRFFRYTRNRFEQPSDGASIDPSWIAGNGGAAGAPPLPAAQNLSALRVVSNINNKYDYANPLDLISSASIAGISLQSVGMDELLTPANNQSVSNQSWTWIRGSPVFLGANGTLIQAPPTTGSLVVVARVLSPQTLFIHIEDPIRL